MNLFIIIISLLALILPALALSVLLLKKKFDLLEHLVVALSLTFGVVSLITIYCSVLNIKLTRPLVITMIILSACALIWNLLSQKTDPTVRRSLNFDIKTFKNIINNIDYNYLVILFIFVLSLFVRLFAVQDFIVPPGSDSYNHSVITELFVETGGLPKSYEPFAPYESFTYHFGFHSVVFFLYLLSGISTTKLILIFGQILNASALLSVFFFTKRLIRDESVAIFSAVIVGLISVFPAYYVNWGRFTQLSGLLILPAALVLTIENIESQRKNLKYLCVASLLLAGLFLTHVRVFLMYIYFMIGYLIYIGVKLQLKEMRTLSLRLLTIAFFTIILTSPWMWNLWENFPISDFLEFNSYTDSHQHWQNWYFSLARIEENSISFYSVKPLILLAIGGTIVGLLRREKTIILLLLWVIIAVVLSNPNWLNYPLVGTVDYVTVLISLYFPVSIMAGYFCGNAAVLLDKRFPNFKIRRLNYLVVMVIAFLSAKPIFGIIDPGNVYVRKTDERAMDWIKSNIPKDARFLINSHNLYPEIGSDAGYWIPLLTGRVTTLRPTTHGFEKIKIENDGLDSLHIGELWSIDLNIKNTLDKLEENGVTHVYIGERSNFSAEKSGFYKSPFYQPVYHDGKVWIFQVEYKKNFFIEHIKQAVIKTPQEEWITPLVFNINGDSRATLFEHPPSKITYKLTVPENSSLTFGIALDPEVWSADKGDGVVFEVLVKDGKEEQKLFSKYIDPKNRIEDRKWHDEVIDLSRYGKKEVSLTFITSPGPSNNADYDWAGWGDPKLISNIKNSSKR